MSSSKNAHDLVSESIMELMGEVFLAALNDPSTIEILVNPDGAIVQEKLGGRMERIGFIEENKVVGIIDHIAGISNKVVHKDSPIVEGEVPMDGSRFAASLPPASSAACFAIRKKASSVFPLPLYVGQQIIRPDQAMIISNAVRSKRNIIVSGGTSSGKTTLLNAVVHEMATQNEDERCLILQDTKEIQCKAWNTVFFYSGMNVSMTQLVKLSLRMRPDRIFLGEVRGEESLDLLRAFNSGHEGGITTLHANNAKDALAALQLMVSMNPNAPTSIESFIARSRPIMIHISRLHDRTRRVTEIISVEGYSNGQYQYGFPWCPLFSMERLSKKKEQESAENITPGAARKLLAEMWNHLMGWPVFRSIWAIVIGALRSILSILSSGQTAGTKNHK